MLFDRYLNVGALRGMPIVLRDMTVSENAEYWRLKLEGNAEKKNSNTPRNANASKLVYNCLGDRRLLRKMFSDISFFNIWTRVVSSEEIVLVVDTITVYKRERVVLLVGSYG